ncbi:excisionase [Burkholderia gladioli]|uniref:excisionase n=1 Tax=Burkholderia gladioli TaxID=28095 RepID=UPI001FC88F16|nr:excisionase [Burkholderia gladioli]
MSIATEEYWLPLEEAAIHVKQSPDRIRKQMWNGRIRRDVHFRRVGDGKFELNVPEYLRWLNGEKEARKLPLVERVIRDHESGQTRVRQPIEKTSRANPPKEVAPKGTPKLIPLHVWAGQTFGEYAPHANTLRRWVRNGKILPVPIKVGRSYFVRPEAEYFDPFEQKIQRMIGRR